MPQNATRNFGLSNADVATLKAEFEATGKFPNPYRGSYGAIVAALTELGLNEAHPFAEIHATIQKQMGEKWDAFASKAARNQNGKDVDGRLLANVQVLQRRKDYGLKLTQLGAGIVKVKQEDGTLGFGLFVDDGLQAAPAASPAKKKAAKGRKPEATSKPAQKANGKPKKAAKKASKPKK